MHILLTSIALDEAAHPTFGWYARVASKSNIADEPSRGEEAKLLSWGARREVMSFKGLFE